MGIADYRKAVIEYRNNFKNWEQGYDTFYLDFEYHMGNMLTSWMPRIIEAAFVNDKKGSFASFCKSQAVPKEVLELTNIPKIELELAPEFKDVILEFMKQKKLKKSIVGLVFGGYNSDLEVYKSECTIHKIPLWINFKNIEPYVNPANYMTPLIGKNRKGVTLSTLFDALPTPDKMYLKSHRALDDALMLKSLSEFVLKASDREIDRFYVSVLRIMKKREISIISKNFDIAINQIESNLKI